MGVPTTMAEADELREWALSTAHAPAPATTDQIVKHLDFMQATLPTRANDLETGRKRVAVYTSILGGQSNEALAYMARTACTTLDWFPTPKQCLEILANYQPPDTPQAAALFACRQFTQGEFTTWIAALREGGAIGDVPEHWQRIAVEQGDLRRLTDGSYVNRASYHGPPRPAYQPPPRTLFEPRAAPEPPAQASEGIAGASAGLVA